MDHISKVIQEQKPTTRKSQSISRRESRKLDIPVVTRIFQYLTIKYGHKWTSQITDENYAAMMERVWSEDLGDLSFEDIKRGLDLCNIEHPKWPPTIGEFRYLCLKNKPRSLAQFRANGEMIVDDEGNYCE